MENKNIKIKFLKKFINPINNKYAEIDSIMNVPKNQFWLRRLKDNDCIEVKKNIVKNKKNKKNLIKEEL